MNRRTLLDILTKVGFSLPLLPILGCGAEDPTKSTPADPINDDTNNDGTNNDDTNNDDTNNDDANNDDTCVIAETLGVANSHGHQITIPVEDLENPPAGGGQYLSTGGHTHTVTLTEAELTELATNCTLTTTNSTGHAHSWTININ